MQKLKFWLRVIDKISIWSGQVTSYLIYGLIGIVVFEVVARYVFRNPTIWVHESSAFITGIFYLLGGAWVLQVRGHVSMEAFYVHFRGKTKLTIDVIISVFLLIFCITLLWQGLSMSWEAIVIREHTNSAWRPPLYPFKAAVPLGAFLIVLQGLANLTRQIIKIVRGETI